MHVASHDQARKRLLSDIRDGKRVGDEFLSKFIDIIRNSLEKVDLFWKLGKELDDSLKRGWLSQPFPLAVGSHVIVRYGLFGQPGKILRLSFDRHENEYRIVSDSTGNEKWINCWRCV